ncbi:MAG: hypothetical protein RL757_2363 [Bacteroidota bacterium]|jgi:hypothetical protein
MKLGRAFNKLTFTEYLSFIPIYESFSDWNTLGLYRSIVEHEILTIEEKIKIRDVAHAYFKKQFDFLQLKDPTTYIAVCSLGLDLTIADERQMWENVKHNQQLILENKKIKHRNFGDYSKHNCGVETCKYFGLMIKQGSFLCEQQIRFDSDKNSYAAQLKSERLKKDRKNKKAIIEEDLEELD